MSRQPPSAQLAASEPLGRWAPQWHGGLRSVDYYDNYDANIRLWLPTYDRLLARLADEVVRRVVDRHALSAPIRILEVGVGTGYLTMLIIQQLRATLGAQCAVVEYVGIDHAPAMVARARRRLDETCADGPSPTLRLETRGLDDLRGDARFDVVVGSFIMNQLLEQAGPEAGLQRFMRQIAGVCDPRQGQALFVDAIRRRGLSVDTARGWWRQGMCRAGLCAADADGFLSGNEVMLVVSEDEVARVAGAYGWRGFDRLVSGFDAQSPFLVVALDRG